jgi:signal transduction histidine kinase
MSILPAFLIALIYYVTGKLSFYYTIDSMIVTISVFFPEGFALAAVLLYGKRVIPGIFAGQFLLALAQDFSLLPSFFIALSNSAEALIAWYLLKKKLHFDTRLRTVRDVYILIGVVIFILQPFSAFWGTLVLYSSGIISVSKIFLIFFSWWFGNIMGQLLLTPFLLYFYHNYKQIDYSKLLFIALLFGVICYAFIYLIPVENTSVLFSITIVPLVMLLSYKHGNICALFSIIVITLIAIYTSNHHIGPFSVYDERTNLINLNFYILAHILIVLIIGVLFIEKNMALKKLLLFNKSLEDKVRHEVKKNREKDRMMFFQSRLAQMGEMLSLITHQWKQPLNNLSLINQMLYLNHQKGELDDKGIEKFYRDAKTQIQEMQKLTEDFKNFFKPDREKKEFCLNDTIEHVIYLLQPVLDHEHISIESRISSRVIIEGYQNEFTQAILNIINNAKDALLRKDIQNRKITISLYEFNGFVKLSIKNNGGGIDTSLMDLIFEPYFSTKDENEGTGLGLYMTKMIIEEYMGGKISVSNDHDGVVFEILFKREQ